MSVSDHDKKNAHHVARDLVAAGLKIVATRGTAAALRRSGIEVEAVYKVNEGRPNIVDLIKTGKIDMLINTPLGRESFYDEKSIRRAAIRYNIPCITTLSAASAAARGIRAMSGHEADVCALQDLHRRKSAAAVSMPTAANDAPSGRVFCARGRHCSPRRPSLSCLAAFFLCRFSVCHPDESDSCDPIGTLRQKPNHVSSRSEPPFSESRDLSSCDKFLSDLPSGVAARFTFVYNPRHVTTRSD